MPLVLDPVCLYVCTYSRCVLNSHLFRWLCKEPDYSLNAGVYVHFIWMDFNVLIKCPRNYCSVLWAARCFCSLDITLIWGSCVVGEGSCFRDHLLLLVEDFNTLCRPCEGVLRAKHPQRGTLCHIEDNPGSLIASSASSDVGLFGPAPPVRHVLAMTTLTWATMCCGRHRIITCNAATN